MSRICSPIPAPRLCNNREPPIFALSDTNAHVLAFRYAKRVDSEIIALSIIPVVAVNQPCFNDQRWAGREDVRSFYGPIGDRVWRAMSVPVEYQRIACKRSQRETDNKKQNCQLIRPNRSIARTGFAHKSHLAFLIFEVPAKSATAFRMNPGN